MDLWEIEMEPEVRAWLESLRSRNARPRMAMPKKCLTERCEMSDHSKLVPGDHLDDPEVRAGYEETRRAIELGVMVRQLRLDTGLSQEELAQRAGMTQPALSRLERGGTVPTLAVLDRIANALQATLTVTLTRAA